MTKKLEEELDLMPADTVEHHADDCDHHNVVPVDVSEVNAAITASDKIDQALKSVKGLEVHNTDMDNIAEQALQSYSDLMELGLNVSDRDAAPIFDNAAKMLKTALEAKDSKVNAKLKQIDLMIKKAKLDQSTGSSDDEPSPQVFDRNQLLQMLRDDDSQ